MTAIHHHARCDGDRSREALRGRFAVLRRIPVWRRPALMDGLIQLAPS